MKFLTAIDVPSRRKERCGRGWTADRGSSSLHAHQRRSWLNPVERFFAEIAEKRIRRGEFESVKASEQAIEAYLAEHNTNPTPF